MSNDSVKEKYCYGNNEANCTTYGGLYQWDEAMQYGGAQGICPTGWHIPTKADLDALKATVSNDGSALKAGGSNTSGFSALIAGYRRGDNGSFFGLGSYAKFWSSTVNGANVFHMELLSTDNIITIGDIGKESGFSVRCIKD